MKTLTAKNSSATHAAPLVLRGQQGGGVCRPQSGASSPENSAIRTGAIPPVSTTDRRRIPHQSRRALSCVSSSDARRSTLRAVMNPKVASHTSACQAHARAQRQPRGGGQYVKADALLSQRVLRHDNSAGRAAETSHARHINCSKLLLLGVCGVPVRRAPLS